MKDRSAFIAGKPCSHSIPSPQGYAARLEAVALCRIAACARRALVILRAIRLERSSGELMLAPLQMTSASRQNLWRLTFIRILVLAAQAGSVGLADRKSTRLNSSH